jgi:hypothetical protein
MRRAKDRQNSRSLRVGVAIEKKIHRLSALAVVAGAGEAASG